MKQEVTYKVKLLSAYPQELGRVFDNEDSAKTAAEEVCKERGIVLAYCLYRIENGKPVAVQYSYNAGLAKKRNAPTTVCKAGVWCPI